MKQDFSLKPNTFLANGFMWNVCHYFEEKGNTLKENEIAKLNNTYLDIWREIPRKKDGENEE
jgi:hypothetical protein